MAGLSIVLALPPAVVAQEAKPRPPSGGLNLTSTAPAVTVGSAQEVTLRSANGELNLRGTLLTYENGNYRIDTLMGVLNVPADRVECTGDACPPDPREGIPGEAVELTDQAGELRLRGTLVAYTGDTYEIDTTLGVLKLPAGGVICSGPGCPLLTAGTPAPQPAPEAAPEAQAQAEAEPEAEPEAETAAAAATGSETEAEPEAQAQAPVDTPPDAEARATFDAPPDDKALAAAETVAEAEPEALPDVPEPVEVVAQEPPAPAAAPDTEAPPEPDDSELIQIARLDGPADLRLAGPAPVLDALTPTLTGQLAQSLGAVAAPVELEYVSLARARDRGMPAGSMGLRLTGGAGGPVTLLGQFTSDADETLKLLDDGVADLIFATAPASLSDERLTGGLVLGSDGMVAVVAPDNPLTEIPTEALARVFAGEITDWAELGAAPGPIRLVGLPESHAATASLSELVTDPAGLAPRRADIVAPDIHTLTEIVAGDPRAIAFIPYATRGETRSLDLVTSCGLHAAPGAETFRTRHYPFTRTIVARPGSGSELATSLLETLAADPQILRAAGYADAEIGPQPLWAERDALAALLEDMPGSPLRVAATNALVGMEQARRLSQVLYFERGTNRLDLQSLIGLGRVLDWLAANDVGEAFIVGHAPANTDPDRALNAARAAANLVLQEIMLAEDAPPDMVFRRLALGGLLPVVCPGDINHAASNSRVEIWVR